MRATISLDDRLAERARRKAAEEGLSLSAFIARILDDALKRRTQSPSTPFRLITVKGEGLHSGVDLDHPRSVDVKDDEKRFAGRTSKR